MTDLTFARRPVASVCEATLSFDDALSRMIEGVTPLDDEEVALSKAAGRVLAHAVVAVRASRERDLAAMDGYAVRDVAAGAESAMLTVVGQAAPGAPYPNALGHGEAVRIFTGAPIPEGTDRVVPQELAIRSDYRLAIPTASGQALHIRARGSDFAERTILLPAGRTLDPRALLVAGAADAGSLRVRRKPRLFTLATGDELCRAGDAQRSCHTIPDSVSPAVAALASKWGADIVGADLVADQPDAIERAAGRAVGNADVLVVTGGASVGERDFSKAALRSIGLELAFDRVAMKPGKPVWYGRAGATHILGLPGNPTAALVAARLFLTPLLCGLQGRPVPDALRWRASALAAPIGANGPRETFLCGRSDGAAVRAFDRQFASGQASLALADVLVRRPAHAPEADRCDTVTVLDF